MKNFNLENVDCHAALAMIEKRWGFPRRTLRVLLGMTKSGQSGRSMIEMLGVLVIIGVLSVGGIAGYSKAMMKYRINKAIEQISMIRANVHTLFSRQKDFAGLDSTTDDGRSLIKKARLVPDEMWDGDSIKGVFGSDVVIKAVVTNGLESENSNFCIRYSGLPQEACIELASHNWASDISELKKMYVHGDDTSSCFGDLVDTVTTEGAVILARDSLPIDLDTAILGCSCSSDTCGIYWAFSK